MVESNLEHAILIERRKFIPGGMDKPPKSIIKQTEL